MSLTTNTALSKATPPVNIHTSSTESATRSHHKHPLTDFKSHKLIKTAIDDIITRDIDQTDLIAHANNMYQCLELLATNRDNDATNLQIAIQAIIKAFNAGGIHVPENTMSMLSKAGLGLGTIIAAPLVATAAAVGVGTSVVTAPLRLALEGTRKIALRHVSKYVKTIHDIVNKTSLTPQNYGQIDFALTKQTERPETMPDLTTIINNSLYDKDHKKTSHEYTTGKTEMEALFAGEETENGDKRNREFLSKYSSDYAKTGRTNDSIMGLGTRAYRYARKKLGYRVGGYTRHNRNISLHSAARTRAYHYKPVRLV